MPHKHTRKEKDLLVFDLPPSEIAKPLPVQPRSAVVVPSKKFPKQAPKRDTKQDTKKDDKKSNKRKKPAADVDDTPRAFRRLMARANGEKFHSGLDDGHRPARTKKGKKGKKTDQPNEPETNSTIEIPKLQPGERMGEFNARVDAALPLGGLISKTVKQGKDPIGGKAYKTFKEKKMHKLYDQWRDEEAKIQAQKEEELEQIEEEELDREINGVKWKFEDFTGGEAAGGKKKKGKKGKYIGESKDEEDDPWEELKKSRGEAKIGLHDVVKAPPELNKARPKKLVVRDSATVEVDSVPKAAGSLRRREELQTIRQDVVETYRKLMESKRAKAQT